METNTNSRYFMVSSFLSLGYITNFVVSWQNKAGETLKAVICVGTHVLDMYVLDGRRLERLWSKRLNSHVEVAKPLYKHAGIHSNCVLLYDGDTMLKIFSVNEQGCELVLQQEIMSSLLLCDMAVNEAGDTVVLTDYEKEFCVLRLNLNKKTIKVAKMFNFYSPLNFTKFLLIDEDTLAIFGGLNDEVEKCFFFTIDIDHESIEHSQKYSNVSLSEFKDLNRIEILDCVVDPNYLLILLSDRLLLYCLKDESFKGKMSFKPSEEGRLTNFNTLMNEYLVALQYVNSSKAKLLSFKYNMDDQMEPRPSVEFEDINLVDEIQPNSCVTIFDRNTLVITKFDGACHVGFLYYKDNRMKLNYEEFYRGMPSFDSFSIINNKIMVHSEEQKKAYLLDNSVRTSTLGLINIPRPQSIKTVALCATAKGSYVVIALRHVIHVEAFSDESGFESKDKVAFPAPILSVHAVSNDTVLVALEKEVYLYAIEAKELQQIYDIRESGDSISKLCCDKERLVFLTGAYTVNSVSTVQGLKMGLIASKEFDHQISSLNLCTNTIIVTFWMKNEVLGLDVSLSPLFRCITRKDNINSTLLFNSQDNIRGLIPRDHFKMDIAPEQTSQYLYVGYKDGSLEVIDINTSNSLAYFILEHAAISFVNLDVDGVPSVLLKTFTDLLAFDVQKQEFVTFIHRNKDYSYLSFFDYHNTYLQYTSDKLKLIEVESNRSHQQVNIRTPSFEKNTVLFIRPYAYNIYYITKDSGGQRCYLAVYSLAMKTLLCTKGLKLSNPNELYVFSHKGDVLVLATELGADTTQLWVYRQEHRNTSGHSQAIDLNLVYSGEREGIHDSFIFKEAANTLINAKALTTLGYFIKKTTFSIELYNLSSRGLRRIGGNVQSSLVLKKEDAVQTQTYPEGLKSRSEFLIFTSFSSFNAFKFHSAERRYFFRGKYADQEFITDCDFMDGGLYMISNAERYVKVLRHRVVDSQVNYFYIDCVSQLRLSETIERIYYDLGFLIGTDNAVYRFMEIDEDSCAILRKAHGNHNESRGTIVLTRKMKSLQHEVSKETKEASDTIVFVNLDDFDDADINYCVELASIDREFTNKYAWTESKTEEVKRLVNSCRGYN